MSDKLKAAALAVVDSMRPDYRKCGAKKAVLVECGLIQDLASALVQDEPEAELPVTRKWLCREYGANAYHFIHSGNFTLQLMLNGEIRLEGKVTAVKTRSELRQLIQLLGGEK